MKTLTILSMLVAVGSLAFFSCQEDTNQSKNEVQLPESSYNIDSVDAVHYILSYVDFIDSVKNALPERTFPDKGQKLVYGASVDLDELHEILTEAKSQKGSGDTENYEFYIMLGVKPSGETDSTHLIFCLEMEKSGGPTEYAYYDFVRPCPTSCPTGFESMLAKFRKED